jgi:hypothetical protein
LAAYDRSDNNQTFDSLREVMRHRFSSQEQVRGPVPLTVPANRSPNPVACWAGRAAVQGDTSLLISAGKRIGHLSHLAAWLSWVAVATACATPQSHQPGFVEVTPGAEDDRVDAAVPDAAQSALDVTGACMRVTPAYVNGLKTCSKDADCEAVFYRPDCCATQLVVGVASDAAADVRACAAHAPKICNTCGVKPTRAEDGRAVVNDNVVTHCVAGQCRTAVEARSCGSALRCTASELCVATHSGAGTMHADPHPGDNALISYTCVANPCQHGPDCSCAQTLCEARSDTVRQCEVTFSEDADVTCVPVSI